MWLNDPYIVEELLRQRAEQIGRAPRIGADRPSLGSRLPLAVRVLMDGGLAARVPETRAAEPCCVSCPPAEAAGA